MSITDTVMSCRVRLARNISGLPFEVKASESDKERVIEDVNAAIGDMGFTLVKMRERDEMDRATLVERHLMSAELRDSPMGALLVSEDGRASVMLNEEDHIRIQCILDGLDLDAAYARSSEISESIERRMPIAYDDMLGYLTACPTNIGTGMRASAMIHLVGTTIAKQTEKLLQSVRKLGIAVRGFYGEGSAAPGCIYQISNQNTLGVTPEEIIKAMTHVIGQIAAQETEIRQILYQRNKWELEDIVGRAVGICRYASRMSVDELMQHASGIKLGISLGIISDIPMETVDRLMIDSQPASLAGIMKRTLDEPEAQRARAALVRERLSTH